MKKSIFSLEILLIVFFSLLATNYFAQASTYTFAQSSGTYTAITGGSVVTTSTSGTPNLDSYVSTNITIPSFTFAGTAYTKMYVTGNGTIALGSSTPSSSTYTVLSTATGGNVFLAPLSADLDDNTGVSEIRYETIGNEFIVQWKNFRRYNIVESINFQVRMNTSAGAIKFVYDGVPPYGAATTFQPQVGIKSATGNYNALTVGTSGSWNTPTNITTGIVAGSVATFSGSVGPTSGLTYTWSPLVLSPCNTPDAPTLAVTGTTDTSLSLAITAPASNVPTGGYLVVRSTSSTPPTVSNGTAFTTGGAYTVVSNGTTTPVAQTGLSSNTKYYYYVYSQNTGCTGAPFYSAVATTSPTTCAAAPTGLSVGSITSSGANFTWTSPAGGSAAVITSTLNIYSNSGATTLVKSFSGVTSVYSLSDALITPATQYWYQIVNSNGICSSASATGTFTSACANSSLPIIEGFNTTGPSVYPSCWSSAIAAIQSGTKLSFETTGTNPTISTPYEGTRMVKYNSFSATGGTAGSEERLISPPLTSTGIASVDVEFYWNNENNTTYGTGAYLNEGVQVQYSLDKITWVNAGTFISRHDATLTAGTSQWKLKKVTLPTAAGNQGTIYVAFKFHSEYGDNMFLDAVNIKSTPIDAVDYANIQSPGVSTTTSGTAVDIYGQAYEPGVTEAAGAGTGLVVWYSKNATDVDPSSAAWTGAWTLATYNGQGTGGSINNDEFKGTITRIPGQADTYYSFRYQLNGGPMKYGGYSGTGGGFWDGTTNKNGKLSVNYEVYTTAVAPNNTVNNTIDVYLRDFDGVNEFYTDTQTSIWMYAGVRTSTNSFQYISTTTPPQDLNNTTTLVEFVRTATNPNLYKATLKFADYFCIPAGTTITGIDLLFRNQFGVGGNNQTANLFLDLGDANVAVNAPTLTATSAITTTAATINWTAHTTGVVKGFDYYYSISNTAPTAGTSPSGNTGVGVTSANLTLLTPGTVYYFWVRTKGCSPDVSVWSTMGTFTTINIPTTYTWNGSTSTSWDIATNWTKSGGGTGIPTSIDSVIVTGTSVPNKLSIAGNKSVTNFELTGSDAASFTITGTNTLTITGTVAYTGTASAVLNCGSTVKITNTSNQLIPPLTYGNLDALGGNRTLSSTGIIKICSAFSVNPALYNYVVTGSTVEYISGSTGWLMSPFNYNNVTFSGSGDFTLEDGTINVAGNFVQSNGAIFLGDFGDPTLNINGDITLGNGVINSRSAYDSKISVGGDLNIINGGTLLSYSNYGTDTVTVTGNVNLSGTGSWDNFSDSGSIISIGGNLTLADNSDYYMYYDTVLTVGGNLTLANDGYFSAEDGGGGENSTITVNGDFSQSGGSIFYLNDKITAVLNIKGNMSLLGSSLFDLNYRTGGNGTVNLKGNLSVDASATLRAGNTNNATFNFNQTSGTIQNINVQSSVAAVDFVVGNQAQVKLLNNLQITAITSLTVNGIFDADDKILSGNNNVNQTFTLGATGMFKTANSLGFSGGAATSVVTSPANSDINVINLIAGSTVEYSRLGDQMITNQTGVGQGTLGNYSNLKISGSGIKTAPVGDTNVQHITTVTAGELLVPSTIETVKPNSFTANKGLVIAGGVFRLANNANLLQDATAVNTGEILAVRDLNFSAARQQYNYLISPLIGKNLKDIYKDGSGNPVFVPSVLYHNETNNKFYNSSGAYIMGRALAVKEALGTEIETMSALFNGVPMNGQFNYNLLNSNADNLHGYNLIGNPYPSNLDLQQFYDNNKSSGNLVPTFYFWDNKANDQYTQAGSGYGGEAYAQYNVTTPTQTGTGILATGDTGAAGTKKPTRYVKIGQGFMARTLFNNLIVSFDNTVRKAEISEGFFGKGTQESAPFDRYWINMTSPANITSQIAVVYFDGGDNAYTKDDSRSLSGSDAIYSIVDGQQISINGKNSFVNSDVQPLGSKHFSAGNYTIALGEEKDGVFANGQNIFLKDKQTGILTNLSAGNYTFQANAGESTGRFEIVYVPETVLATDSNTKENLIVYKDGNDFVVKAQSKKITGIDVYDTAGRLILALNPNNLKAVIPAEKIVNGVYVLKINQNGQITSKKIVK